MSTSSDPAASTGRELADPRGVRFSAAVTSAVLTLVLLTGSGWLLAAQALVFALGAFVSLRVSPYSALYRVLLAPRLPPPGTGEDPVAVRFSQAVGFVLAAVGAAAFLSGATVVGLVATAFALAATFLNAAFGFCLGCEMYALIVRFRSRKQGVTT